MFGKKKSSLYNDEDEKEVYGELLLDQRRTFGERLTRLSYMQAAMGCFAFAVLLFVLCIALAISSGGDVALSVAILCLLSFLSGGVGLGITLFGHFAVGIEGKMNWKLGLFSNLIMMLVVVGVFVLGITGS